MTIKLEYKFTNIFMYILHIITQFFIEINSFFFILYQIILIFCFENILYKMQKCYKKSMKPCMKIINTKIKNVNNIFIFLFILYYMYILLYQYISMDICVDISELNWIN